MNLVKNSATSKLALRVGVTAGTGPKGVTQPGAQLNHVRKNGAKWRFPKAPKRHLSVLCAGASQHKPLI